MAIATVHGAGMATGAFHVRSLLSGSVTAVDACSGRSFARHAHDKFGIGLIMSGAQRSSSGRRPVEAIRGNLITVNPAEIHAGVPIGADRSWSMLYFATAIVASVVADLSEGKLSERELHAPVVEDLRLARFFLEARDAGVADDQEGIFEERSLMVLARLFGAVLTAKSAAPRNMIRVRERINVDPTSSHALDELAALAGLGRFQTLRAFALLTGLTPHAYVVQKRLDLARRLIRNGSTLADAAADAGFADQSHMHRIFVARHGFSPGIYAAAARRRSAISFKRVTSASR